MNKVNAIVGQSGGPTSAINATLAGVIKGAADSDAINRLYGAFNGIEGLLEGRYCDITSIAGSERDLNLLKHTPAAALGSCRLKLPEPEKGSEVFERLFSVLDKLEVKYFFYIGGNDSMDTVDKMSRYAALAGKDIRVMGVPKTIDNDLCGTDHTPGYGSAAKYIAAVTQEILRDTAVYSVKAVTIIEIMGRDAGWLTASAALPGKYCGVSPDLVYLPEVVFSFEEFYEDIEKAFEKKPNVVVAVSEGVRTCDGKYVGEGTQSGVQDAFGHRYLSGTAKTLENAVKERFGCKVRSVELNIPQRCAAHCSSKTDIDESVQIGYEAVNFAVRGDSGKMMCFERVDNEKYKIRCVARDISEIANKIKKVPREFINERGNNVNGNCIDYIMPLISGEAEIEYQNGLPVHFVINR